MSHLGVIRLWASQVMLVVKNLPASAGDVRDVGSVWQPTPAFLPVKFHGQRNLLGYGPSGCKESDTADPRDTHILMFREW